MFSGKVRETTGCPFSDAVLAGLTLDPQLRCGRGRLQGARLIWDPSKRLRRQLRDITELTAKWRARRGLHIVRTPIAQEGTHDDEEPTTAVHARDLGGGGPLANTNDASERERLRTGTAPAATSTGLQSAATPVRVRRTGKLPLGV